jgi:ABC-type transport system involved in cytochrome c biogenesis permease component
MTLLPIVGRELRVAARRKGVHITRTLVALAVVAIYAFLFLLFGRENASPQDIGQTLFAVVGGVMLAYCLFAGVILTADCLSAEKREGTLGLLFLTDLKGYDVVLGKLVTTSINAVYTLLAVLPMLALPLLLGGVSAGEFQRVALVCLNTMFFSLTVGLYISAVSYHARKATSAALGLILLLTGGCPLLGAWLDYGWEVSGAATVLVIPSPIFGMASAFDAAYRGRAEEFWTSALLIHLLAWLCLVLASAAAKRTWQDRPKSPAASGWRRIWQRWLLGSPTERRALRKRLLQINPFLWRVGRERWKGPAVWLAMGGVGLLWLWAAVKYWEDWVGAPSYLATAFALTVGLKWGVAGEAGHAFGEDRRNGALELMLGTPLSAAEIVRGQLIALCRQFLAPACATLGVCFLFLLLTLLAPASEYADTDDRNALTALWVAGMIVFVADCMALAAMGMWQGLVRRHSIRATGITLAWILGLPWIVFALGVLWFARDPFPLPSWAYFLGLWVVPSLVVDCVFGIWAWRKLRRAFRQVVLEPLPATRSWWRRIFGVRRREPEWSEWRAA